MLMKEKAETFSFSDVPLGCACGVGDGGVGDEIVSQ